MISARDDGKGEERKDRVSLFPSSFAPLFLHSVFLSIYNVSFLFFFLRVSQRREFAPRARLDR